MIKEDNTVGVAARRREMMRFDFFALFLKVGTDPFAYTIGTTITSKSKKQEQKKQLARFQLNKIMQYATRKKKIV